ncbi:MULTISPECIES: hypothetical protein [Bradyrhizobium]|uniref:hypothetical protein n=1 Tax=Bradyrhizobium TaxID=374 RepID=UPI001567C729|nr:MULTISPECIES: hypothetical protein [Bradyrhizobium]
MAHETGACRGQYQLHGAAQGHHLWTDASARLEASFFPCPGVECNCEGTLIGTKVDQIIASTITARSIAAEGQRRRDWAQRECNAAAFRSYQNKEPPEGGF